MTDTIFLSGSFRVQEKIGSGAFSNIYLGTNIHNGHKFAVKRELKKIKNSVLWHECKVLQKLGGIEGIPRVYHQELYDNQKYIVMDLLGPSLEDVLNKYGGTFQPRTVLILADKILKIIEHIHNRGFIHRDIKPENFLIGRSKHKKQMFAIDFGLAQQYPYNSTLSRKDSSFKFYHPTSSIRGHLGLQQSRRDDLESVGYMLIYFLKGKLPWQNLKHSSTEEIYQKTKEVKIETSIDSLCQGQHSSTFAGYMTYCKKLTFHETPDYQWLRSLFQQAYCDIKNKSNRTYEQTTEPVAKLIDIC